MKSIILWLTAMAVGLSLMAQEIEMAVNFLPEENWAEARAMAAEKDKYIFVDAYTEWCYWCKVQDKNTFTDEAVGEYLNGKFVPVKLDFERGDGLQLARKYRVQAYPSLLFFNSEGELVGRTSGYIEDNEKFMDMVKEKTDPENHLKVIGDPDVLDPGFPEFYVEAFGTQQNRSRPSADQVGEWLDQQEDLYTEVVYNVLMTMPLNEKWSQYFLENHEQYAERFHADEVQDQITSVLMQGAYQAMRDQDEEALEATIERMGDYLPEEQVQAMATNLRLNFYMRTENMEKLLPLMAELAQDESGKYDNAINSVSWNLYQNSDDDEALAAAKDWMEGVLERNPDNYAYTDTQAALLYKLGQLAEAKDLAEQAIEMGKAQGEDVKGTEELMEKIQTAMQER